MKQEKKWAPESAELAHLHNTADNDCSETHRHVLKMDWTQLNVKSQGSLKLPRCSWLLYHADVFYLCRLCSPTFWTLRLWSRLSARLPPLSLLPLLFTLSIDTPPLLSLCFTGGGGGGGLCLPPAPASITQNLLSNVPFDFFQMNTSWPPSPSRFIPKLSTCSLFVLLFFLWFHSGLRTLIHVASVVLLYFLILDIFVQGLFRIIGHCHIFPFLSLSQCISSHLSCQHCLNTWTFFVHKIHSLNSRASHDLHWATFCCTEKICWRFKGVTVWNTGLVSDH